MQIPGKPGFFIASCANMTGLAYNDVEVLL